MSLAKHLHDEPWRGKPQGGNRIRLRPNRSTGFDTAAGVLRLEGERSWRRPMLRRWFRPVE
jgi:hypothetical protein